MSNSYQKLVKPITLLTCLLWASICQVYGQCSAIEVVPDTNLSCAPGIFTFVVKGAPKGSHITWNFGKGNIPGKDTFNLIEVNPKNISLTLTVDRPTGGQCVKNYAAIAKVIAPPTPQLTVSTKILCSTDDLAVLKDNTPNSAYRIWTIEGVNYGDTLRNRNTKFTTDGKKTISLMVEDSFGCRGVRSFVDALEVIEKKDIEIVGLNHVSCVGTEVDYRMATNILSTDIKSVDWQFDGALNKTSTAVNPTKIIYPKEGRFDVSVTIKTNRGCTYKHTEKGIANPRDSVVINLAVSDSVICVPNKVQIRATNKGLYGIIDFDLDMVDTNRIDTLGDYGREFPLEEPGEYDLRLRYRDSFCVSNYEFKKLIYGKEVRAIINSKQHYDCEVPFLAKFTNASRVSEPGNLTYRWAVYDTFGKFLAGSIKPDFDFLVKDSGYYDVEFIVRHENGCADSTYQTKLIRADSIRPDCYPVSELVCVNQNVLMLNATPSSTYKASDFFIWKLYKHGDTTKAIDSAYTKQPTFKAIYQGSYDMKVIAYNSLGCRNTIFYEDFFEADRATADFVIERPEQCNKDTFSGIVTPKPARGEYIQKWMIYNATDTFYWPGNKPVMDIVKPGLYNVMNSLSVFGECRDTAVKTDYLQISGFDTKIKLPSKRTCANLPFKPTPDVTNYVYGSTDTHIGYEWRVFPLQPNTKAVIDDDSLKEPAITFLNDGDYVIRLIVDNELTCKDTTFSDTIHVGFDMAITFRDTVACANAEITFVNETDTFTNRWFHTLSPNQSMTIKRLGEDSTDFSISKNGEYTLSIIASRDSLCFDTLNQTIQVVSPEAEFTILDSNLYCAPVYQRFRANPTYVDTFFWDFGDGKTLKTTSSKVTTVYLENTGNIKPFSVQLIAKNKTGCSDTIVKKDLIKIAGPAIDYKLNNLSGCEPLPVSFTGKTDNVSKMYIDFGDGEAFGYNLGITHDYRNRWRIIEEKYQPVILIVDKNGCQVALKSDSVITVRPSPTAIAGIIDTVACGNLTTTYYYLGNEARSWYWDFDGNGTPDGNNAVGKHQYKIPGHYNLTLINENKFDCYDTAITPIHVVKPPSASILAPPITCITKPVVVSDTTHYDAASQIRRWDITENGNITSRTDSSFVFDPTKPGNVKFVLSVTDSAGCTGKDSVSLTIKDSTNSEKAALNYVLVLESGVVQMNEVVPTTPYLETTIYREDASNQMNPIKQHLPSENVYDDSFSLATNQSVCYQINHSDSCLFQSEYSDKHCTVYLTATAVQSGLIRLNWTPYIGWDAVDRYQIFRMWNGNTIPIAYVDGNTLTYDDSTVCDFDYRYMVVAVHKTILKQSTSNIVSIKAWYDGNNSVTDITRVTVVDNQYVRVFVDVDTSKTILTKTSSTGSQQFNLQSNVYDDFDVDVNEVSVSYTAQSLDQCQIVGNAGRMGKSILLNVAKDGNQLTFNWTAYRDWEKPVESYTVLRKSGGVFIPYKQLPGTDTSLQIAISAELNSSSCFKILASLDTLQSESNESCIEAQSVIFIPTAFSPNDENLNDVFKPFALFIKSPLDYDEGIYDFRVYNRWGELVFQSNNPEVGWDGSFKGDVAPIGTYMYTFRVRGLNNRIYNLSGSVTLLR